MVAAALCIGLAPRASFADWKDDYARGLEAVQDGRWSDVAKYMQEALNGNAEPAKRVRLYGQRWETYAPQHYAGLAAYKQGNCAAAQRLWSSAANRGLVSGISNLAAVETQANKDCDVRLASQTKPDKPPGTSPANPPVKPVASNTPPVVVPEPPPSRPPPPKAKPTPPPERKEVASTPTRAPSASELLRPFVENYLAGNYDRVLRLSSRDVSDARLQAQMQLFRAAAAYREAALQGGDEGMATARAAVAAARKADPSLRPDATFFPPRFLAFYNGRQ